MGRLEARLAIIQAQQVIYDEMRERFEAIGTGGRYRGAQKRYALGMIDQYGVRATARILHLPRRTLQRWCRAEYRYVRRCPAWVYVWAERRRKRRQFWQRRGVLLRARAWPNVAT